MSRYTRLHIIPPKVNDRLMNQVEWFREDGPGFLYLITHQAPLAVRRYVQPLTSYFAREFGYGNPYLDRYQDETCEAWLWTERLEHGGGETASYGVGHATFDLKAYRDDPVPKWTLTTVWLHPFRRREGYLTHAWPVWRGRYGAFWVDQPWSEAMARFLRKQHFEADFPFTGAMLHEADDPDADEAS